MLRTKVKHIDGRLTWAKVGQRAVDILAKQLLHGERDAIDNAILLGARLEERDANKSARVTSDLRNAIQSVVGFARALQTTFGLAGSDEPDEEAVRSMMSLYQRFHILRRTYPAGAEWIRSAVQKGSGAVLQSNAHQAIKDLAARAVAMWSPPREEAPIAVPQKRMKLSSGEGISLAWGDGDDDLH